jgi:hypothetical protein
VRRRLQFLLSPGESDYFISRGTTHYRAAHLVALLTDQSPEWVYSAFARRRGL